MMFKIYYWPILTSLWFSATFVTAYIVAVPIKQHVYYFFPYISDTGALPPESCIFGQMLNIAAALMAITMYVRHRQVTFFLDIYQINLNRKWVQTAFVLGFISCAGISIVANFQETTVGVMHFFGAIGAFGIGSVYFLIQTRITSALRAVSNKNDEVGITKPMYIYRFFLSFWLLPLFFGNLICSTISMQQFDGETIVYWTDKNAGFELRLVATFTEWILAIFMILYILTFIKEFKVISFKEIGLQCNCEQNVNELS